MRRSPVVNVMRVRVRTEKEKGDVFSGIVGEYNRKRLRAMSKEDERWIVLWLQST